MKKVIVICVAIFLLLTISVSALAANGGFVSSPSTNQAPSLLEVKNGSEDCSSMFAVMSYASRNDLSEEARKALEDAYASIKGTTDLTTLNPVIADVAEKLNVESADLAVSDMFDLAPNADATIEDGEKYEFSIKSDTLANFVCLLHYVNGAWEVVEGAEVADDGETLEFAVDGFSPFAVVVSTGDAPEYSGGISASTVIGIIAIVLAVGGLGVAAWFALIKFDVIKPKKA